MKIFVYRDDEDSTEETTLDEWMAMSDDDGVPLAAHSANGDAFCGIFAQEAVFADFKSTLLLVQWDPAKGPLLTTDDAGRDVIVPPPHLFDRAGSGVCDTLMVCDAAQAVALIGVITRFAALVGWDLTDVGAE